MAHSQGLTLLSHFIWPECQDGSNELEMNKDAGAAEQVAKVGTTPPACSDLGLL